MTHANPVIVPPSLLKLLPTLMVGGLGMAGGLFFIIGLRTIWLVLGAAVGVLMVLTFVAAAITQRPRVTIGRDGFVLEKLIGSESHKWEDIAGPFAAIKIGWTKGVGYHFSAAYNARVGKKPTTKFSGYNAVIMGAFKLTAAELAELLNRHKHEYLRSADTAKEKREM
jgi:hypothetical protein